MSYRSMSVTQFTVKQKRAHKAQPLTLSQLPDGSDFLDVVDAALAQIASERITDDEKQSYAEIEAWSREGRTIFVKIIVGTYGDTRNSQDLWIGVSRDLLIAS